MELKNQHIIYQNDEKNMLYIIEPSNQSNNVAPSKPGSEVWGPHLNINL